MRTMSYCFSFLFTGLHPSSRVHRDRMATSQYVFRHLVPCLRSRLFGRGCAVQPNFHSCKRKNIFVISRNFSETINAIKKFGEARNGFRNVQARCLWLKEAIVLSLCLGLSVFLAGKYSIKKVRPSLHRRTHHSFTYSQHQKLGFQNQQEGTTSRKPIKLITH
jgi:hypothetical protein